MFLVCMCYFRPSSISCFNILISLCGKSVTHLSLRAEENERGGLTGTTVIQKKSWTVSSAAVSALIREDIVARHQGSTVLKKAFPPMQRVSTLNSLGIKPAEVITYAQDSPQDPVQTIIIRKGNILPGCRSRHIKICTFPHS